MGRGTMKEKLRTVKLSLTEDEWVRFYAYARVKGFGTRCPIADLARTSIVAQINRYAPTGAQEKRIEEIIEELKGGRLAVMPGALEGN
jgi:hypothetical protein